jgi:hypothetical protein
MPSDKTRTSDDIRQGYKGPVMQQGRVILDRDFNALHDTISSAIEADALDIIGPCGTPDDGFAISIQGISSPPEPGLWVPPAPLVAPVLHPFDFLISPGTMYVGGQRAVFPAADPGQQPFTYSYFDQPDWIQPDDPSGGSPVGTPQIEFIYLHLFEQEVSAVEDSDLKDVALGGPDTTQRLRLMRRVRRLPIDAGDCASALAQAEGVWLERGLQFAPPTMELLPQAALQVGFTQSATASDPCDPVATGGYLGAENQLIRVQISDSGGGTAGSGKLLWGYDNASFLYRVTINPDDSKTLQLNQSPVDAFHSPKAGQVVEVLRTAAVLESDPDASDPFHQQTIVRCIAEPSGEVLTLAAGYDPEAGTVVLDQVLPAEYVGDATPVFLRIWQAELGFDPAGGTVELADAAGVTTGVQVTITIPTNGTPPVGAYWMIAVRPSTPQAVYPERFLRHPQPPDGPRQWACPLAVIDWTDNADASPLSSPPVPQVTQDCRNHFPPLTHICAKDVCFDNDLCKFPGAETVQDAIDALCGETDLKTHNKYLHGAGVVCGLKLRCDADRTQVLVEPGYALECEGDSIHLRTPQTYKIVEEASAADLLVGGDGDVCVGIKRGLAQEVEFSVEAIVPQSFWDSVLEGTLPKDFYEDCIETLLNFVKSSFLPIPDDTVPVSAKQKRVISFLNLLAQLINSASGPYVFLSTDEHQILLDFYNALKQLIASETYCAMFDGDRPFPAYPYAIPPGIETAFGLFKFHGRLRLHPSGNYAYTCGGPTIQVYDLQTRTLHELLTFPGGSNVQVQDMAFSQDGSEMYVVALNNQDSVFVTVTIGANQSHTWGSTSVVCDFKFVSLATSVTRPGQLLALAKAEGLYSFNPANMPLAPGAANQVSLFNATGLLALSDDTNQAFAFAAESLGAIETSTYDQVRSIDLATPSNPPVIYQVSGNDPDNDVIHFNDDVHITGNPSPGQVKSLYSFVASSGLSSGSPIDLQENTPTRLAVLPGMDQLLVTLSDRYKLVRIDLASRAVVPRFRVPVQIMPIAASIRSGNEIIVLNYFSNTLSIVDIATVISPPPPIFTTEPPTTLSAYRQQILDAYADLLSHLLQHLKDCFCDHYLVDCPDCTKDTPVYLGCVEIKGGQVFNICNLSKRHYVKTFKTYGYWLSTIPILPIVKEIIARFCCRVL